MGHSPTAVFGQGVYLSADDADYILICERLGVSSDDDISVDELVRLVTKHTNVKVRSTDGDAPAHLFHTGKCWAADWDAANVSLSDINRELTEEEVKRLTAAAYLVGLDTDNAVKWWVFADNR